MEKRTRVYPAEKPKSAWISGFLLLLSLVIALLGLIERGSEDGFSIRSIATPSPAPMNDAFDETPAQKEMTLPASKWYALQLGAFSDAAAAQSHAEQFIRRGAGGYVWHDGRYRVLAAVYPDKDDAQLVRQQLENGHGVDTYLYDIQLPAIQIRLSGMQGQLDMLEAAFLHANDLIVRLQQLSITLDRREASQHEALLELTALNEQMQAASLRLGQRFTVPRHACVDGLMELFDEYGAFCQQLDPKSSGVALGALIKRQTLSSLNRLKQVYDTLGHT